MKLIIPPPILFLFCIILIAIFPVMPIFLTTYDSGWIVGIFIVVGSVMAALSLYEFRQAKTTINPQNIDKTTVLITTGIYRVSRNPMYLSLAIFLLAWTILCENAWGFFVITAFVVYLTQFQIKPEEKLLEQKFGKQYLDYKQSVRRWI